MNQITSKSVAIRLCLISFILLCSVFTCENVFSIHWDNNCARVTYNQKINSIICSFLFHQYSSVPIENGYIRRCKFCFSEDGITYFELFSAYSDNQQDKDQVSILLSDKCMGKNIKCFTPQKPLIGIRFIYNETLKVVVSAENLKVGVNQVPCKMAYLTINWELCDWDRDVKYIKIDGYWYAANKSQGNRISEDYKLDKVKSKSNTMHNAPSEFNSEINDKVKVTGETDAINVTGAEPGENIKVYTTTGAEVKSVVANDDVITIKLPDNQMYIVNVGKARYKVALCVP